MVINCWKIWTIKNLLHLNSIDSHLLRNLLFHKFQEDNSKRTLKMLSMARINNYRAQYISRQLGTTCLYNQQSNTSALLFSKLMALIEVFNMKRHNMFANRKFKCLLKKNHMLKIMEISIWEILLRGPVKWQDRTSMERVKLIHITLHQISIAIHSIWIKNFAWHFWIQRARIRWIIKLLPLLHRLLSRD